MQILDRAKLYAKNKLLFRSDVPVTEDEALFKSLLAKRSISPSHDLKYYVDELSKNNELSVQFNNIKNKYKITKYSSHEEKVKRSPGNVCLFYALIRELKPRIVVETGTAAGSMTSYVLAALCQNGKGRLYSIDIPPISGSLTMEMTIELPDIGFFIPDAFKELWTYIEGDARRELLPLMARLRNEVDYFIHDSLHTSTHMLFEYSVARTFMQPDTIMVSDDIRWNRAFYHFCSANQLPAWSPRSNQNLGICLNQWSEAEYAVSQPAV